MHQMVTGRLPFSAEHDVETCVVCERAGKFQMRARIGTGGVKSRGGGAG